MSNKRKTSPPADLDDFGTIAIAARDVGLPDSTIRSWINTPETSTRIYCRDWYGVRVLRLADVRAVAADPPKVGRKFKVTEKLAERLADDSIVDG